MYFSFGRARLGFVSIHLLFFVVKIVTGVVVHLCLLKKMIRCGSEQALVGTECFLCGKQAFGKIIYRGEVEQWYCFEHYKEVLGERLK